jgi:excinuclease ABC subunit A
LLDVGLGYLGTWSERYDAIGWRSAQRVKIASELLQAAYPKNNISYLTSQPLVLHYEDVKKLIEILQQLVNQGNTVMVIEHNLDLIKCQPTISLILVLKGGLSGGDVVAKGTPEDVAE